MQSHVNKKGIVVITDLDGTLLDQQTYSYEQSLPAIEKLREAGIPLILCSSKTAAEMLPLQHELELKHPFICESGGAIYLPQKYFQFPIAAIKPRRLLDVIEFGENILNLRKALQEAAQGCGARVKFFGGMTFQEIMFRTGLTLDQAIYARQREYDVPFYVDSGDEGTLLAALRASRLTVTKGDRFYHLTGGHGKGEAVKKLLDLYRRQWAMVVSVGLGNSANDLPFLREVDRPVLVRNPDRSWDPEVIRCLPSVARTECVGPQGWREAIEKILAEIAD
jgi:mannosyl-3-phosphoglycerate phosphatase